MKRFLFFPLNTKLVLPFVSPGYTAFLSIVHDFPFSFNTSAKSCPFVHRIYKQMFSGKCQLPGKQSPFPAAGIQRCKAISSEGGQACSRMAVPKNVILLSPAHIKIQGVCHD
jgi:hypothetical protein